ncbi:MAG TPA: Rieske 2Fe-2S domain-containing protein [Candidatus Dormibacteraeota bacterium]
MLLERVLLAGDLEERRPVRIRAGGADVVCVLVEGTVFAFRNSCPHTGYKLHLGRVRGCVVTCSSHLAQFDLRDGHLVSAPMEGQDIPTGDLAVYRVIEEDGHISIEVPE